MSHDDYISGIPMPSDRFHIGTLSAPEMTITMGGIVIKPDGVTYKGETVNDAGAVHRALMEVLSGRATLAQLGASVGVPEIPDGWKLVPVEPTPEMAEAFAGELQGACGSFFEWESGGDEAYAAMLDAAQSRAQQSPAGEA